MSKKMIKLLGAITTLAAPAAIVVSCGASQKTDTRVNDTRNIDVSKVVADKQVEPRVVHKSYKTIDDLPKEVKDMYIKRGYTKFDLEIKDSDFQKLRLPDNFAIPEQFTMIASNAFHKTELPKDFDISSNIKNVQRDSFSGATVPGSYVFNDYHTYITLKKYGASLNNPVIGSTFEIPSTVTEIGYNEFMQVTLPANFRIPKTVKNVQSSAFYEAKFASTVTLSDYYTLAKFKLAGGISDNIIISNDFIIPSSISTLPSFVFKDMTIPSTFKIPVTITKINAYAFANSNLPFTFSIPATTNVDVAALHSAHLPHGFVFHDYHSYMKLQKGQCSMLGTRLADDFSIPSGVTELPSRAFANMKLPQNFTIPTWVTQIGSRAFYRASLPGNFKLTKMINSVSSDAFEEATLPNGQTIDNFNTYMYLLHGGFDMSMLTLDNEFSAPIGGTYVERNSFSQVNVPDGFVVNDYFTYINLRRGGHDMSDIILGENFTIPEGVRSIEYGDFANVVLPNNFKLPESVRSISSGAFTGTTLPKGFSVSRNVGIARTAFVGAKIPKGFVIHNSNFYSALKSANVVFEEVKLSEEFVMPYTWRTPDGYYAGLTLSASFRIPRNFHGSSLAFTGSTIVANSQREMEEAKGELGIYAGWFKWECHYAISQLATEIPDNAFEGVVLPSDFIIPDSVTKIGDHAFDGATLPSGFTIPDSVTEIGEYAFANIEISQELANSLSSMPSNAFEDNVFSMSTLKDGIQIKDYSTLLILREQLNSLPANILANDFVIPSNVSTVPDNLFKDLIIPRIDFIPDTVRTIGKHAFASSKLPDGFIFPKTIEDYDSTSFEDIVLPRHLVVNTKLKRMRNPRWPDRGSVSIKLFENVTVPSGYVIHNYDLIAHMNSEDYDNAPFADDFKVNDDVTDILPYAFKNKTLHAGFRLPENLETICARAFENANILGDLEIPSSVKEIQALSFQNATFYGRLTVPHEVTAGMRNFAFKHATFMKRLEFNDELDITQAAVFSYAKYSDDYKIHDYNELVLMRKLYMKPHKTIIPSDFVIPSDVTIVPFALFMDLILPDGFTLHDSISVIAPNAFNGAVLPESFKLPNSLTKIRYYAFRNAIIKSYLFFPPSTKDIARDSFNHATFIKGFTVSRTIYPRPAAFSDIVLPSDFELHTTATMWALSSSGFRAGLFPRASDFI